MFEIHNQQYAEMRRQVFIEKLLSFFHMHNISAKFHQESNRILVTNRKKHTTQIGFCRKGFIGSITTPSGREWIMENEDDGKIKSIINPDGSMFEYFYNQENDIECVKRNGEGLIYLDYKNKNCPELITVHNRETKIDYNNSHSVTQILDHRKNKIKIQYNDDECIQSIEDEEENKTTFDYSIWDMPDRINYADGSSESYIYNSKGLLEKIISDSGDSNDINYNDNDQPCEISFYDGNHIYHSYNSKNNITSSKNSETTINYKYDDHGRLKQVSQDNHKINYEYEFNDLKKITYPSGNAIQYSYDMDNRLESIIDWEGRKHIFSYNNTVDKHQFPNGLISAIHFNEIGLPGDIVVRSAQHNFLFYFHYEYNKYDQVEIFEDSKFGKRTYIYDEENQLKKVISNKQHLVENFEYDRAANRIKCNNLISEYNNLNQVTSQGNTTFHYDKRGNITEIVSPNEHWQYTFNAQNLLIRAKNHKDETVVTFGYDPIGRRIWKRCGEYVTKFFWMSKRLISEVSYHNLKQINVLEYIYKPNSHTLIAVSINNVMYFYHTDIIGLPRRISDKNGNIVWESDYSAFGKTFITINSIQNNIRFPGQYFDEETGLYYNVFRYYSANIGRYISRDPIGISQGLNLYAYVRNNPINLYDPLGLFIFAAIGVVVASVTVGRFLGHVVNELLDQNGFDLMCAIDRALTRTLGLFKPFADNVVGTAKLLKDLCVVGTPIAFIAVTFFPEVYQESLDNTTNLAIGLGNIGYDILIVTFAGPNNPIGGLEDEYEKSSRDLIAVGKAIFVDPIVEAYQDGRTDEAIGHVLSGAIEFLVLKGAGKIRQARKASKINKTKAKKNQDSKTISNKSDVANKKKEIKAIDNSKGKKQNKNNVDKNKLDNKKKTKQFAEEIQKLKKQTKEKIIKINKKNKQKVLIKTKTQKLKNGLKRQLNTLKKIKNINNDILKKALKIFPKSSRKTEKIADKILDLFKDNTQLTIGVLEDINGNKIVAFGGGKKRVQNLLNKLEKSIIKDGDDLYLKLKVNGNVESLKIAKFEVDKSYLDPVMQITKDNQINIKSGKKNYCVEPKLFDELSAAPKYMTVKQKVKGKELGDNFDPDELYYIKMDPCPSCAKNASTILKLSGLVEKSKIGKSIKKIENQVNKIMNNN